MTRSDVALVAPYAAWMAVLSFAPQTAEWYAVRSVLTAALLGCSAWRLRGRLRFAVPSWRGLGWGIAVGLVVFAVWILPGGLLKDVPSPYDPSACGWFLTIMKLVGSAFVISVAEELFFRKWLVGFAGFWWMVVLFAVEHGRWDSGLLGGAAFVAEGAFCGIAYGLLARRQGLAAAIVAHAVTNFVLGLWVILRGAWCYW